MRLNQLELIKLLPIFMRNDKFNIYLSKYLSSIMQDYSKKLSKLSVWNSIEELTDDELDIIAWELDIDNYNSKSDILRKREIVKSAVQYKINRCSKKTILNAIRAYAGNDSELYEYFETDGLDPWRYEVTIKLQHFFIDKIEENNYIKELEKSIKNIKNLRSTLEKITYIPQNIITENSDDEPKTIYLSSDDCIYII